MPSLGGSLTFGDRGSRCLVVRAIAHRCYMDLRVGMSDIRHCQGAHLQAQKPFHRSATRNNDVVSEGPSGFKPGVPRANAVTSRRMLAQMI